MSRVVRTSPTSSTPSIIAFSEPRRRLARSGSVLPEDRDLPHPDLGMVAQVQSVMRQDLLDVRRARGSDRDGLEVGAARDVPL